MSNPAVCVSDCSVTNASMGRLQFPRSEESIMSIGPHLPALLAGVLYCAEYFCGADVQYTSGVKGKIGTSLQRERSLRGLTAKEMVADSFDHWARADPLVGGFAGIIIVNSPSARIPAVECIPRGVVAGGGNRLVELAVGDCGKGSRLVDHA